MLEELPNVPEIGPWNEARKLACDLIYWGEVLSDTQRQMTERKQYDPFVTERALMKLGELKAQITAFREKLAQFNHEQES